MASRAMVSGRSLLSAVQRGRSLSHDAPRSRTHLPRTICAYERIGRSALPARDVLPPWVSDGGIRSAGVADGLLYGCALTLSGDGNAEIVWNRSTSVSFAVRRGFTETRTLDDSTVNTISGGMITVGSKPAMISTE
jgi:hypothetical protein